MFKSNLKPTALLVIASLFGACTQPATEIVEIQPCLPKQYLRRIRFGELTNL